MTEATMSKALVSRQEVPVEHTWNAESVYPSREAARQEAAALAEELKKADQYRGRLSEGAGVLADWLELYENLLLRGNRLYMYGNMAFAGDNTDQEAAGLAGLGSSLYGQAFAVTAFTQPELLSIGRETLERWMREEPRLAHYAHSVDNLFRKQAHVASADVEQVLGLLQDPFATTFSTRELLANADLKFRPAVSSTGEEHTVSPSTIDSLLNSPDRELRRTAWESYADGHLAMKNTFTSNWNTALKLVGVMGTAKGYRSTLEAALFEDNIPVEVYENLLNTYKKNLPTWHRYWRVRRKALGVETLHPYDIWAPLNKNEPVVSYEQAVDWICEGLAPLGEEYASVLRRGCLEDRWIDRYPNLGKGQAQFSSGVPGTHPFIMLNYTDDLGSMSTLAHELGHSMHSYLTRNTQPLVYADYTIFVAEVASNFNQAMVRAHLLKSSDDRDFQIAVLQEAMDNFHRYFFIMPTLALFEREVHRRIAAGEPVTADALNSLMADLFEEAYGGEMHVDRDRVGVTWAEFIHMYMPFYVFQYATGISAANALAKRILEGQPGTAEKYLDMLKLGSSAYPLDTLKVAGIDMTSPQVVDDAFAVLASFVDRLEQLTA